MYNLVSKYKPSGDQPQAIKSLVDGIKSGKKHQVLLGATGTGKTFTIANVIKETNKKTLVLAHNKTLAGQLYSELKELFPENRVEYFVSYYDYYQPEAYIPGTDTYIEKDSSINDEIDQLRHAATSALMKDDNVIVVSSVSCIYGIGEVEEYKKNTLTLSEGDEVDRNEVLKKLIDMLYERNDMDFKRGTFRVRGDVLEIIPVSERSNGIRIEFFGEEIDRISEIDSLTGRVLKNIKNVTIFAASHYVTSEDKLKKAIENTKEELSERIKYFEENNKPLEKERIEQRTKYDIEMLTETGFCSGVENYSRHLSGRKEGETPNTLMDFFGSDYLLVIDESHVTIPQVRAMYNGDRARKTNLVEYGFRLPSALDNRPLKFSEFEKKTDQIIYISATPGDYELALAQNKVNQIIRPTGLLDPTIEIRETKGQIDDLVGEIRKRVEKNERVLITTLTIRMSEELTKYLKDLDIKVAYLHSEITTLERLQIIRKLRKGIYDVIVGINLLREGLDLPEVSLIAIFDADKEGFLRSETSLIQTMGRAARNLNGQVVMFCKKITRSMQSAIDITTARRKFQDEYNRTHGITPHSATRNIEESLKIEDNAEILTKAKKLEKMPANERAKIIKELRKQMLEAAAALEFEKAAALRDEIAKMKNL